MDELNHMNNGIQDMPEFKGIQEDVREYISANVLDARSSGMFANRIRLYFLHHKDEYNQLLKNYNNDHANLCASLVSALNNEFKELPVKNPDYLKLENNYKALAHEMEMMKVNNPNLSPTDKRLCELYTTLSKVQSSMAKLPPTVYDDLRYKSTGLTGLLNDVMEALSEIVPDVQPSDIEARRNVSFTKKMGLDDAIYTLLWNTRGQTLPLSVMNLKAWSARFVERLTRSEDLRSNLPTMLIMRSRTNQDRQKGNVGKTRICHSCLNMLALKGLKVSDRRISPRLPTSDRVDKKMSDTTLVFMDDVVYKDCDWETLNNFCDGIYIKNKGKYQKEGYILPFGSILGTSNHDIPYTNRARYPEIEFTEDDASIAQNDPVVKEHAKYSYDAANDTHDYGDAWETLFAYAKENSSQWLEEYRLHRKELATKCSTQRNKAEELVLAYLDQEIASHLSSPIDTFHPREVVSWIKREYFGELKFVDISTICTVLNKIGVQRANTTTNPYLAAYRLPTRDIIQSGQNEIGQKEKWDWIEKNASLPYERQSAI